MRKILLFVAILMGQSFSGIAHRVAGATLADMGDVPKVEGLQPLAERTPLIPTDTYRKKAPSASHRVKDASAEDFIGQWAWSGINGLVTEILPNTGMMTVKQNPSNPARLVVEIPDPSIKLDAYVEDGKLYIPNQHVAPCNSINNRDDVWFVNYTYRKADQSGPIIVPAETQVFYFQMNDDGMLSAGVPRDVFVDAGSLTDEEFEEMVCIGALEVQGEGYFWFCQFISANKSLVYKDKIAYVVDTDKDKAYVVTSDIDIENAHIEESITWEGRNYPVTDIYSKAFAHRDNLKTVSIPPSVIYINNSAFANCISLESIKIPDSVYKIGDSAFSGCYALRECDLGNSVQYLGNYIFAYCENLKRIMIPNSVIEMGEVAFSHCYGLESVILGDSLTELNVFCFINCSRLKEVKFGNSIKNIGYAAFNGCKSLENIELPASLENIDGWAFSGCTNLKAVTLPASLVMFDPSMFAYCENLQSIEVDPASKTYVSRDGVVYLKDCSSLELFPAGRGGVFYVPDGVNIIGCSSFHSCVKIREIVMPESVVELGLGAFVNCLNLRTINIPGSVSVIPSELFVNSPSLTELTLPASVETIEKMAFKGCTSLTNVKLGEGITLIEDYAFDGCDALSAIYSFAGTPPETGEGVFPQNILQTAKLFVQQTSITAYLDATPWNQFSSINRIGFELTLSDSEVTLAEKEVYQLGVYGSADKVIWTSSDNEVAYANECGLIVARKAGTSTITATADGLSASCNVTVVSPQEIAGKLRAKEEVVEPTDMVIESVGGNPPMVNLRLIPVGSRTVIDWFTSDSSIATVEDGLVIFFGGEGEIDFTAESANGLGDKFYTETNEIESAKVVAFGDGAVLPDIYNLQGICIKKGATLKDIEVLPVGLYIIGGKKVLKK